MRYKLLSAASALAMAMAIGGAQAAELLTGDQLDSVSAGAAGAAAAYTTTGTIAAAGASNNNIFFAVDARPVLSCDGPCAAAVAR